MAATIAFVGGWEGLRLQAYKDSVGVPTVCYGETRGVEMGDSYTKAQCDAMLVAALAEFEAGVSNCIDPWRDLPVNTQIALVSWAYNVGIGAACGSTAVKRFNRGDYVAACDAITWFRKGTIGGVKVVIPGLVNRRSAEYNLCVEDLDQPRVAETLTQSRYGSQST
jgi:lysozyme